ncbi:MAG: hypothetical protein C4297_12610 [Gemmataceae bacterium]
MEIDRLTPATRPREKPAGFQRWHFLSFLHWEVPPDSLVPLLPPTLALDTWQGRAWLGVVCFTMTGVRPWWFFSVPGVSSFHETNVRTYVHHRGQPGVWFFSLDAASRLAVWIGRRRWKLNYHYARMTVQHLGTRIVYRSRRVGPVYASLSALVEVTSQSQATARETISHANPGTLEHFLVERYILYTQSQDGRLWTARVYHAPYPLQSARVLECQQSLAQAVGVPLAPSTPPDHVLYSPGVAVSVYRLHAV